MKKKSQKKSPGVDQEPVLKADLQSDPKNVESSKFRRIVSKTGELLKYGTYRGHSILNGIVGNHLNDNFKALEIPMQFRYNDKKLLLEKKKMAETFTNPHSVVCIFVHGLLDDENAWDFGKSTPKNYGTLLEKDLKMSPFYVRYNTGLHVSQNGKLLSELIDQLCLVYPVKIKKIILIGHSMGGLVSRSATQYGAKIKSGWLQKCSHLITLGTPHLGAPMEKIGNITSSTLLALPLFSTRLIGKVANMRSDGIKDLRFGYTDDQEWSPDKNQDWLTNNKVAVELLKHIQYFAISGSLTKDPDHLVSLALGDSLVRKSSASGDSVIKDYRLDLPKGHLKQFAGFSHSKLAQHPAVYRQLKKWLQFAGK